MELNAKEIDYIIDLLDTKRYNTRVAINKVLRNPNQYIDDVGELRERVAFIDEIITKLQDLK